MFKFLPSRTSELVEKSLSTLVDVGCRVKYLLGRLDSTILPLYRIFGPKSQVVVVVAKSAGEVAFNLN